MVDSLYDFQSNVSNTRLCAFLSRGRFFWRRSNCHQSTERLYPRSGQRISSAMAKKRHGKTSTVAQEDKDVDKARDEIPANDSSYECIGCRYQIRLFLRIRSADRKMSDKKGVE
ncbi:hypothetical protein GWI33_022144 [Rhynchophorus ferrugineus]|uniref:Uncharacterized protein n=1 Tax=Rhynchophorus ferrugineus TaxID=354439 RepID=A0A834MJ63_RHYFE|nr:hypothetical protein GWI33_022144 [Rhynchophorus ferrugineus]